MPGPDIDQIDPFLFLAVILFAHAEPLGEPVVAHGPFVMNTRDEIRQAMMDYQMGTFGDSGKRLSKEAA